jgi:hypothetical protein
MQVGSGAQAKPAIGVVFDCDMGNRIDDVLALALLYGFDNRNEARVVSVSVSKANLKAAALADAIMRFYVTASMGQFASFARTLPVGFADDGKMPEDTAIIKAVLEKRDAQGKPLYPNAIHHLNDTAECGALIRNALTAQHDGNAVVVLAGPATNLAKVLSVPGAKEIIASKVRMLVVSDPESNNKIDLPAAKRLFAEWPGPVVICGAEVGASLPYPGASIEKDYGWTPSHPVVDAYRASRDMPYDAPASDMAAVLYAVRFDRKYFQLSEPGTATVGDDGRLNFTPAPDGKHRRLVPDPLQADAIRKIYTEFASAKPAPRRPRFLSQQQVEPEKPKPASPKPPSP